MKVTVITHRTFFPIALLAAYGAGRLAPANVAARAAASTRSVSKSATKPLLRRGFRFRIHPEKAAGYKAWHRRVAPQLLRDLSAAGVSNYSLFLDKDGTVFGYMEARDWPRIDREMAKSKANGPWQKIMKNYIVQPKKPGESGFVLLEEVFHLK